MPFDLNQILADGQRALAATHKTLDEGKELAARYQRPLQLLGQRPPGLLHLQREST